MTITMSIADKLTAKYVLSKKKSGNPVAAAAAKHTACLRVKPSINFALTAVKSFGIDT
jgi:hypothetical protein